MRQDLFGCHVDVLNMEETIQRVEGFIISGKPHQHVVINVNKVIKAGKDENLRRIIDSCDLINCDGMPIVWASKLLGKPLPERVAGIDLFAALVERAALRGWRVFFLGAKEEVVTKVVEIFKDRYPDLQIAGYRNGYWSQEQEQEVVDSIADSKPDILFVAISSPKKEDFLGRHQTTMQVPFAMGVGGSFDVLTGLTRRAPLWMQKIGLEWFYRFLQEPRRMFGRYFIEGSAFFGLLLQELINKRRKKDVQKKM